MAFSPGTYVTEELIRDEILAIGDGYRAKNSELRDAGLPFARVGNINNGFHFEGADCFPVENIKKVGEKKSRSFDSVFTSKGTVGRIAFVKQGTQEFVYSPQLCYWRSLAPDILDPRFLNYWMNGREFVNQVDYLKGQTDMADYVSLRDQRKMTITIPPIAKQKKVAIILGALDDRIELNHQINQTLEQIAQAIFKSWFVDFEPVKAKQHIRALGGNDEQAERAAQAVIAGAVNLDAITTATDLKALDQQLVQTLSEKLVHQTVMQREQLIATAGHFPDQLVESEIGLVPALWEPTTTLDSLVELVYGKALRKTIRKPGPYPVYGSGGITGEHDTFLVDAPGVIVGRKGTVGSLYWEDNPFYPIDTVFYVKVKNKIPLTFIFYLLQTLGLNEMNTDAAVPGLNRNNAYRIEIPEFPESLVFAFAGHAAGKREQIRCNTRQSNTLKSLRDSLLPRFLSGDLEVNQPTSSVAVLNG